jgi:membrane protease YdiL (CAAX protease family)
MLYAGERLRRPPRVAWAVGDLIAAPAMAAVIAVPILAAGMVLGHLFFSDRLAGSAGHVVAAVAGTAVLYGALFAGTAVFTVGKYDLPWEVLRFRPVPREAYVSMVPLLVVLNLASGLLQWLLAPLSEHGSQLLASQVSGLLASYSISWGGLGGALLMVGVVAPIVEETYFRGMLYGLLRERHGALPAIAGSAVIFAAAHTFVYGHDILLAFPQLVLLGLALAWVVERTHSLYPAIVLHGLNNAVIVVALFWSVAATGFPLAG